VTVIRGGGRLDLKSWPEALPVCAGSNERFDHLSVLEVAVELIQLRQPEIIAGVVRIGSIVSAKALNVSASTHEGSSSITFGSAVLRVRPTVDSAKDSD
jgi:hypothetical protein